MQDLGIGPGTELGDLLDKVTEMKRSFSTRGTKNTHLNITFQRGPRPNGGHMAVLQIWGNWNLGNRFLFPRLFVFPPTILFPPGEK